MRARAAMIEVQILLRGERATPSLSPHHERRATRAWDTGVLAEREWPDYLAPESPGVPIDYVAEGCSASVALPNRSADQKS